MAIFGHLPEGSEGNDENSLYRSREESGGLPLLQSGQFLPVQHIIWRYVARAAYTPDYVGVTVGRRISFTRVVFQLSSYMS